MTVGGQEAHVKRRRPAHALLLSSGGLRRLSRGTSRTRRVGPSTYASCRAFAVPCGSQTDSPSNLRGRPGHSLPCGLSGPEMLMLRPRAIRAHRAICGPPGGTWLAVSRARRGREDTRPSIRACHLQRGLVPRLIRSLERANPCVARSFLFSNRGLSRRACAGPPRLNPRAAGRCKAGYPRRSRCRCAWTRGPRRRPRPSGTAARIWRGRPTSDSTGRARTTGR
jgi:hypothetical protein